jgi:hypothetical protein
MQLNKQAHNFTDVFFAIPHIALSLECLYSRCESTFILDPTENKFVTTILHTV